jgi:hypothetical protein
VDTFGTPCRLCTRRHPADQSWVNSEIEMTGGVLPHPHFLQEVEEFIATCTELECLEMQDFGLGAYNPMHFHRSHSHPTVSQVKCCVPSEVRIHLDLPSLERLELYVLSPLNLNSGSNRRICFDGDKKPAVRYLELWMASSASPEHAFPTALVLYLGYCRALPTLSSIRIKLEYRSDLSWMASFLAAFYDAY